MEKVKLRPIDRLYFRFWSRDLRQRNWVQTFVAKERDDEEPTPKDNLLMLQNLVEPFIKKVESSSVEKED